MSITKGEQMTFGGILWRILERQEDRVLLLSEEILCQKDYHEKPVEVTWKDCSLRRYLQEGFLERFSEEEKKRILKVTNRNPGNPWYGVEGEEDTLDRVFLLSMEECVRLYFGDSGQLLDFPSPRQRYWFQRKDQNNQRRRAAHEKSVWWWWVRTPGKSRKYAVYVHGDGNIGIQGNGVSKRNTNVIHPITGSTAGGVRPALWIHYEKGDGV